MFWVYVLTLRLIHISVTTYENSPRTETPLALPTKGNARITPKGLKWHCIL